MPADAAHTPIESTAAAYWVMLRRIALAAAAIDLVFLLLYGLLGATALALLNLASIAMYAAAWWLLHLRKNVLGVLLMWFEVLAHAAAGSLLLGWEADFHYFLLLFVPAIVVGVPHRLAIPLMAVLLAFYAGLYLTCRAWAPLSPLPPVHFEIARWFNIVLVFSLFYGVAAFYRQRVRAAESAMRRLARIDALTGLSNRAHFQERAAAELSRARREGRPLTVMLADVDHFKVVNDTHGHDAGDLVLAAVARSMASTLREHDLLARWGGEEFIALLPATPGAEARAVAERVRQAVASTTVVVDGRALSVTLSFGLAEVLAGDLHGATRRADEALYASKRAGRNRLTHADDPGAPPAPGAPAARGDRAHDDGGAQGHLRHSGLPPP